MALLSRSRLLAALVAAGVIAVATTGGRPDELAAGPNDPYLDSDGDLLPDTLEWVLMSDPWKPDTDADGDDDFLEATQFQLPRTTPAPPVDHEFRTVTHIVRLQDNTQHVIVNLLFHIADGNPAQVLSLMPLIDFQGTEVPFPAVFMAGLQHIGVRPTMNGGLYLLLSSRLCSPEQLELILPCSIGGSAVIGQRTFHNGNVLMEGDGTVVSIVELKNRRFSVHPIDSEFLTDPNEPQSGFWVQSKVCELELVVQGMGGGYVLAQVTEAGCTGAPTLGCAPSCDAWVGRVVGVPDSLSYLTGY